MNELLEFINSKLELIYILILAIFIGVELIKNVPSVLHTPLMSGANALSGVVIVGALLVMMQANPTDYLSLGLGFVAVADRMLQMFKKKK
jgi:NAD(P) transhydrogenase subunit alpha